VVWSRLILPDGSTVELPAQRSYDQEGYSGLKDKVNRHYVRTFGSVFLYSAFGILPVIAEKLFEKDEDVNVNVTTKGPGDNPGDTTVIVNQDKNDKSAAQVYTERTAESFAKIGERMTEKNLNIPPTIKIRPGFIFNIFVNRDIVFTKPYTRAKL